MVGVCVAALSAPFLYGEFIGSLPVLCASRGILGIPCPACGLTRACCALARGDLRQALELNALCLPLLAFLVTALGTAAYELAQAQRCHWYRFLYSARLAKWCLAALFVFHLGRLGIWLYDGTLFDEYLRPAWLWRTFADN